MSTIVFINLQSCVAGGGEVYFRRLIDGLRAVCPPTQEFHLLTPPNRELDGVMVPQHAIHGIVGNASLREFFYAAQTIRQIRDHLARLHPDLVVINGDRASYIAPFLLGRIPVIGIKHMPINTFYKVLLNSIAFRFLDRIVCISDYHRRNCIAKVRYTKTAEKIRVIHNCVDIDAFPVLPCDGNSGRTVFLEVASLCPRKGQIDALEAFAALPNREQAELWFAGEGENRQALETLIAQKGLQNQVKLLGHCRDTLALYKQAHVVILPSYEEGMPLSLLEAMSCGRPVIATPVAGVPEMLDDGVEGYLVPPGDRVALTARMTDCIANPKKLMALGIQARRRVESSFSQQAWLHAWRTVLGV